MAMIFIAKINENGETCEKRQINCVFGWISI
jgi:hypothetical protein